MRHPTMRYPSMRQTPIQSPRPFPIRGVSATRTRIAAIAFAFALAFAIPPTTVFAQEDDPFDTEAFDSGVAAAVGEGGAEKIEFLAGGTFLPSVSAVATSGFGGYSTSGSLSGKLFGKVSLPRYGSLYLSYAMTHQFLQGRGGDMPIASVPARSLFAPVFTLSELHFSFDIAKALFIRFGNQLISWGPSRIWTPVDFINLQKADSFQGVDLRVGKPGLRFHVPLKSSNLFAFADFSGTVDTSTTPATVRDFARYTNLGLRYDLAFAGFETGLTAYAGLETQARAGLDFSGRLLGTTVYGEAALLPAYAGYDFSWMASVGFDRKLGELKNITLSGEFFYKSDGEADESDYLTLIAAGRFSPTYVGKYYAYAGLSVAELFSPDLSTSLSAIANLADMSASVRLTETVAVGGLPPFSLILGWTGGGPGKAFTIFSGDGALSLTLQSRIEF